MGHRLSKIYTRTGDDGTTGLGSGERVAKDHPRVEAYGTIDELNSTIGLLISELALEDLSPKLIKALTSIQHTLFDVGSELCVPGYEVVEAKSTLALEEEIETMNAELKPLEEFILPGGSRSASICHIARTQCRRAERLIVSIVTTDKTVSKSLQSYINRLSDWLFVCARIILKHQGKAEVLWKNTNKKPK